MRKHVPMELGRCFMFEEIMPLREKQSGRVDNFEGDLTGLCHTWVSSVQSQTDQQLTFCSADHKGLTSSFQCSCSSSINISKTLTISSWSFSPIPSSPSLPSSIISAKSSRSGKSESDSLSPSSLAIGSSGGRSSKLGALPLSVLAHFFFLLSQLD